MLCAVCHCNGASIILPLSCQEWPCSSTKERHEHSYGLSAIHTYHLPTSVIKLVYFMLLLDVDVFAAMMHGYVIDERKGPVKTSSSLCSTGAHRTKAFSEGRETWNVAKLQWG